MKQEYLFLYNIIQWGGWLLILWDLLFSLTSTLHPLSSEGYHLLYIFQLLAILEVIHSAVGLVRADPITNMIQVLGRLQVILVHFLIIEARDSAGNAFMISAWCLVEIVRYLYLALNTIGIKTFPLLWLRYSLFYVLYPIGVYGEIKVLYDALPGIDQTELFSWVLPNDWNASFSFGLYIRLFIVFAYIPGFLNQYTYMIRQRRVVFEKFRALKGD
jgi:very-long-chain (3R)-3-hydroxyacyl-CoA dehydratase